MPTPSDIDIAQAVEPAPIWEIAEGLGLRTEDYEQHGPQKAKVRALGGRHPASSHGV